VRDGEWNEGKSMSDEQVPLTKQINIPPVWLLGTLLVMWLWHSMLPIVKFGTMASTSRWSYWPLVRRYALARWAR